MCQIQDWTFEVFNFILSLNSLAKGGGNFEIDPRTSETSYRDIRSGLHDSRQDFLGDHWMDDDLATYGNKKNTYSGKDGPLLFDYLLHKSNRNNKIKATNYNVIDLKTNAGKSFSNHEAVIAKYSLMMKN